MLNCLYRGKRINALRIVEEFEYEQRKEIKLAGSKRELRCEDCDAPMYLKVCKNRQSHFAHWRGYGEECTYYAYTSRETEQHKLCKTILYSYFRELYPSANIELEYKAIPNRRSDIYIEFDDGNRLAIDIQRNSLSTAKWDDKHSDYKRSGITDIWIILGKPTSDNERTLYFFQQIMLNESMDKTAIFLDVDNEEVTLLKKMELNNKYFECDLYKRIYKLSDIVILPDGRIKSEFNLEFKTTEELLKKSLNEESLRKNQIKQIAKADEEISSNSISSLEQVSFNIDALLAKDKKNEDDRLLNNRIVNSEASINNSTILDEAISVPKESSTGKRNLNEIIKSITMAMSNSNNSNSNNSAINNVSYISQNVTCTGVGKATERDGKVKGIIKSYVGKISRGQMEYNKRLIELLHGGPSNYRVFMEVLNEFIALENLPYTNICKEVLKKAGLG